MSAIKQKYMMCANENVSIYMVKKVNARLFIALETDKSRKELSKELSKTFCSFLTLFL